MPRVSQETLDRLNAFIDSLPVEARSKCALCNETLTHLVKTAEVQTGAGTATVTRALAERINENAAPGDVVSDNALRQRVIGQTTDKNLSVRNEQITNNPDPSLICSIGNDGTENKNLVSFDPNNEDQLMEVGELLAQKIESGEARPRVGTIVSTAVKEALRKGVRPEPKQIDNFDRGRKHALALAECLNFWADGTMKPETEDEAIAARIILHSAPSIITHYSRLGINILAIYETFIDPNRREKNIETKEIAS